MTVSNPLVSVATLLPSSPSSMQVQPVGQRHFISLSQLVSCQRQEPRTDTACQESQPKTDRVILLPRCLTQKFERVRDGEVQSAISLDPSQQTLSFVRCFQKEVQDQADTSSLYTPVYFFCLPDSPAAVSVKYVRYLDVRLAGLT